MKCVVAGYGSRGDVEPCIAIARLKVGVARHFTATNPDTLVADPGRSRPPLSAQFTGNPAFDAGLGSGRQHDEPVEFSACPVIGVLALLRSCRGVGRCAQ
jgi:hypothetical protein